MNRRVLFVDDEQKILDGLCRMLRPLRNEWDMSFSSSGPDALSRFEADPFDVVVSDMRMPGMNGDEFLTEVRKRYPRTLRVVLTGEAHRDSMIRVIGIAHRVLTKPLDAEKLKDVIRRSCELRNLLKNPILEELINRVGTVPSPPTLYSRVVEVLENDDWSIDELGRILADDVGVSAKLVQLANSSLFGLRWTTSNTAQAVQVLGTETTKSLVLTAGLISSYDPTRLAPFTLGDIWAHSRDVGTAAARIATANGLDGKGKRDAAMAGILHDIGRLILADVAPDKYRQVLRAVAAGGVTISKAERDVIGTTHAEAGAYLLGLWGLPENLVEAVAWHHNPADCPGQIFDALAAVHAAESMVGGGDGGTLDLDYLSRFNATDAAARWTKLLANLPREGAA